METRAEEHAQLSRAVLGCRGLLGFPRDTTALRGQRWVSIAQGVAFLSV